MLFCTADGFCRKLARAYETISDPEARRIYDIKWVGIRYRKNAQKEAEKRQADATKTEQKRAAEEKMKSQKEQAAMLGKVRQLEVVKADYDSKLFELKRVIRKLAADLKRLQEEEDEALRKERERNGWWAYFTSAISKQAEETAEEKRQRAIDRLQRLHTKSIKENELIRQEAESHSLKDRLQDVNSKIAAAKQKGEDAARAEEAIRQERLRNEREAKRRAEAQEREKQAAWEAVLARRRKEAAAALAAKQAREAQEAYEAQEQQRRAQAAKRAREIQEAYEAAKEAQEAQKREQRARAAREAAQRARNSARESATARASASKKGTCRHDAFWPKVQGAQLCDKCHIRQKHFAFQCPGCNMIACANCRQLLRGERGRYNPEARSHGLGLEEDYGSFF